MPAAPVIAAVAAVGSLGYGIYSGERAAAAQHKAQQQALADQARNQKMADARKPNTSALMAAALKGGSSSGTSLTGATGVANVPLGGGSSLLGG